MKLPTEKPSEPVMRFFTPDLYRRFNSPDDDEADRANAAWEATIQKYQSHLDGLRPQMTSQVRKLADLCLHDAEVLSFDQEAHAVGPLPDPVWPAPLWSALAILSFQSDAKVFSLIYLLWDGVREHAAPADWPFSKVRKHWLYDEIDLAPDQRGMFVHRILFSDGSVLEIPFYSVILYSFPLPKADADASARQIA